MSSNLNVNVLYVNKGMEFCVVYKSHEEGVWAALTRTEREQVN